MFILWVVFPKVWSTTRMPIFSSKEENALPAFALPPSSGMCSDVMPWTLIFWVLPVSFFCLCFGSPFLVWELFIYITPQKSIDLFSHIHISNPVKVFSHGFLFFNKCLFQEYFNSEILYRKFSGAFYIWTYLYFTLI